MLRILHCISESMPADSRPPELPGCLNCGYTVPVPSGPGGARRAGCSTRVILISRPHSVLCGLVFSEGGLMQFLTRLACACSEQQQKTSPWCEVASKTPYRRPLLDEIPKRAPWQTCAHRHFNGDKVALEPRCDVLGLGLRHQLRRGGRKRVFLALELTGRQTGISGSRERSVLNLEFPKASTEPMMTGAIRLPVSWHRLETARWTPCIWCGTLIRCADRGGIIISRCCTHTRAHALTHTYTLSHTYSTYTHTTHGSSPGACWFLVSGLAGRFKCR